MSRLQGAHALVTRPRERSEELCFLLEDEGARVTALPLLELQPPADPRPLQAAAERLQRYEWVAFASPSAVMALCEAARQGGTFSELRKKKLAAVGPKTALAAQAQGLTIEREASGGGAALGEALKPLLHSGDRVLLPTAEEGRPELQQALEELGAEVTRVCAYRSVKASLDAEAVDALRADPPSVAFFASPRTAEAFCEALGAEGAKAVLERAKVIAIGPTTRSALEDLGLSVAGAPSHPTAEAMVEAAVVALRGVS